MVQNLHYITYLHLGENIYIKDSDISILSVNYPGLLLFGLNLNHNITDKSISELANNCCRLTYLCLDWCPYVGDISIKQVANECTNLRYLSLSETDVSGTGICAIMKHCRRLKYFNVLNCFNVSIEEFAQVEKKYVTMNCKTRIQTQLTDIFNGREPNWEKV